VVDIVLLVLGCHWRVRERELRDEWVSYAEIRLTTALPSLAEYLTL
jgi:hypothetical protein